MEIKGTLELRPSDEKEAGMRRPRLKEQQRQKP